MRWLVYLARAISTENGGGDGRASSGRVADSDSWPERIRLAGEKGGRKGNRVREKREKSERRERRKNVSVG